MANSTDNLVTPPAKLPGAAAASTRQVPTREGPSGAKPRRRKKPKPPKRTGAEDEDAQTVEGGEDEEHQVNYLA
jgi:hypothetical protein